MLYFLTTKKGKLGSPKKKKKKKERQIKDIVWRAVHDIFDDLLLEISGICFKIHSMIYSNIMFGWKNLILLRILKWRKLKW